MELLKDLKLKLQSLKKITEEQILKDVNNPINHWQTKFLKSRLTVIIEYINYIDTLDIEYVALGSKHYELLSPFGMFCNGITFYYSDFNLPLDHRENYVMAEIILSTLNYYLGNNEKDITENDLSQIYKTIIGTIGEINLDCSISATEKRKLHLIVNVFKEHNIYLYDISVERKTYMLEQLKENGINTKFIESKILNTPYIKEIELVSLNMSYNSWSDIIYYVESGNLEEAKKKGYKVIKVRSMYLDKELGEIIANNSTLISNHKRKRKMLLNLTK